MIFEEGTQISHYQLIKEIDSGAFGNVWLAQELNTEIKVAIKSVENNEYHRAEVATLRSLNHPFIVSFYESIEIRNQLLIIMEYLENGTLLNILNYSKQIEERIIHHLFTQLLSVLDYMHNIKHIIHRDLKCENIMMDRNWNVRVIDFGHSCSFETPDNSICGSIPYLPPEVFKDEEYDEKMDIWAIGIILYCIVCRKLPFYDKDEDILVNKIITEEPELKSVNNQQLSDLILRILDKDQKARFNIKQILQHPWMSAFYSDIFMYIDYYTLGVDQTSLERTSEYGFDPEEVYMNVNKQIPSLQTVIYKMVHREKELNDGPIFNPVTRFHVNVPKPIFCSTHKFNINPVKKNRRYTDEPKNIFQYSYIFAGAHQIKRANPNPGLPPEIRNFSSQTFTDLKMAFQ